MSVHRAKGARQSDAEGKRLLLNWGVASTQRSYSPRLRVFCPGPGFVGVLQGLAHMSLSTYWLIKINRAVAYCGRTTALLTIRQA